MIQIKKLVSMASRTGRDLQRYNFQGCRQVVGCIPYRFKNNETSFSNNGISVDQLEFLLISSQKSCKWMFPKGGWEMDETMEEAAIRETMEEAGVLGTVGNLLGSWIFKSKSQDKCHEGYMLSFMVTEELDVWPEKDVRRRIWVSASEAREKCEHLWMKMALDSFIYQEFGASNSLDSLRLHEPTVDIVAQRGDEEDIDCHMLPLTQLKIKEDKFRMPCVIQVFSSDERAIHIVAQAREKEGTLCELVQQAHRQRKEEESRMPCWLDLLMAEESRIVMPSGDEDAYVRG